MCKYYQLSAQYKRKHINCLPNKEMAPQVAQTMRQNPTDPASCSAMEGETKIPDPAVRSIKLNGHVCQAVAGNRAVGVHRVG
jgi:hypothetical protein